MIVKYTGLGFFLSWLWLFLMHGPLLYEASALMGVNANVLFCYFLGFHSISFLIIFLVKNLMTSFHTKLVISSFGSVLVTGITLWICFYPGEVFYSGYFFLYGSLFFCGLGAAMLLVMWGEFFASVSDKQAALYYTGSILTGTALFFFINSLQYEIAAFSTALLPAISMLFLYLSLLSIKRPSKQPLHEPGLEHEPKQSAISSLDQKAFPFPIKLILIIFLFYLVGGILYRIIYLSGSYPTPDVYWLTNLIYCTATILAGIMIVFFKNIKTSTLFRPALFLLGSGFILFPLLFKQFEIIPFTFFQSGFAFFDIFIWLLFTEIAKQKNPIRVFTMGYFFVTFSLFLGEISFTYMISFFPEGKDQLHIISLSAALIMFFAALIFDEKSTSIPCFGITPETKKTSTKIEKTITNRKVIDSLDKKDSMFPLPTNKEEVENENMEMDIEGEREREKSSEDLLVKDFLAPYNLTPREAEIVTLLLQGRNNPYIRESLNISPNTLKTHLRNIFRKFSINNRQELLSLYNKE